ncbi:hypothetical protein ACFT7S_16680 [Streptomyces sp. NPDC057136]|uniref:hypothetical protein n=1 Tax=Streptomyces sp. NPDC057136 TaxID=3346029 RepID=UPI0036303344
MRLVLAVIGLLAWWYLFRCLADTWGSWILRRVGRAPSLAVAAWIGLSGSPDTQRVLVPALGVLALAVLLLWPAMAVWHLLAGSTGQACAPGNVPDWWPALLPIG